MWSLQSLLPSPQEGRGSSHYSGFETEEQRASKVLVQDDNSATIPDAHAALVYLGGPKRCLFSHPDSPSSQSHSEIRVQGQSCV